VHAACVAAPVPGGHVTVTDVGLMSMTAHSTLGGSEREAWIARGEGFARRPRQDIDVPATTMSAILDDIGVDRVDLLLLDVEGAEIDVLSGLDFARHAPRLIVAEDAHDEVVSEFLAARGYARVAVLLERRFTRDCLYRRGGGGPAAG
jgi:FkbM family methyltransferase